MAVRALSATALYLLSAACGRTDQRDRTAGLEVRDSAGVEIVSNAQPEQALAVQEVLRIGVVDGDPDYQFQRIRDLAVDSVGGIWVVDAAESVRRYGPDGRLTTRVGARGSAPGEAAGWGSVVPGAGGVALHALGGGTQVFDLDGAYLASHESRARQGSLFPFARIGGRWIMQRTWYPDTGIVVRSTELFLTGASPAGPFDTIASFPGQLSRAMAGMPVRAMGRASFFAGDPSFGIDGDGRLHVSDSLAYRIERYDPTGNLERILSRAAEPIPYDPTWVEAMIDPYEAYLGREGRTIDRRQVDRMLEAARPDPEPAHLRFIQAIHVGRDGTIWVERADRHPHPPTRAAAHHAGIIPAVWPEAWRAPRVFDVFDPSGQYHGTADFPPAFTPMVVHGMRIYGVVRDELDVEYVTVFEVSLEA